MDIEFVNHSSIVIREGDISLMCDFWQDGTAFDDGWKLLCEPVFDYPDFADITHLWISHEHPDHFSPANLKSIPEGLRSGITILFQATQDKRVVSFCSKLGFKDVVELSPFEKVLIGENMQVMCAPYGASWADVDSWLWVKTPTATLLNINDCEIHSKAGAKKIADACGPIDVLATQFSYASKQADSDNNDWIDRVQNYHLDRLEFKLGMFQSRYVLPFASFVYWCHNENRYLNKGVIKVQRAVDLIQGQNANPVVMYPGDSWAVGTAWDNTGPLQKYANRYDWLEAAPDDEFEVSGTVPHDDLVSEANAFLDRVLKNTTRSRLARYIALQHSDIMTHGERSGLARRLHALMCGLLGKTVPAKIYVEDIDRAYEFSLVDGLRAADHELSDCHIRIGSAALRFGFSVGFGGETLQVNGRFNNVQERGWQYLSSILFLARRMEQGFEIPKFVVANAVMTSLGLKRKHTHW